MADFYATNTAGSRSVPPVLANGGDSGGRQRVYYDEYVTAGSEVIGDRILIGKLRAGQRFVGGVLAFGAMGSSRTFKLGDADDDDRFLAATSVAAAGHVDVAALAGFGLKTAKDADLFLTVGGGTLPGGQPVKICLRVVSD